jgi:hypothetical protein
VATIVRGNGLRVVIFPNDHPPPHVHVFKAGTEAIINLTPLSIRDNYKMSRTDLHDALELVAENHELLVQAWNEMHDPQ